MRTLTAYGLALAADVLQTASDTAWALAQRVARKGNR